MSFLEEMEKKIYDELTVQVQAAFEASEVAISDEGRGEKKRKKTDMGKVIFLGDAIFDLAEKPEVKKKFLGKEEKEFVEKLKRDEEMRKILKIGRAFGGRR